MQNSDSGAFWGLGKGLIRIPANESKKTDNSKQES
jgi:hypothetical protein